MASSQSTPLSALVEGASYKLPLAIVDLTGDEAREWLQGQVTQDLRTLEPGGATRACLCKPTGQLLAHLEIWALGDRLRLLIHHDEIAALLARVEEAVIMEDVEATVVPGSVWHQFGGGGAGELSRSRSRTGVSGRDLILQGGSSPPPVDGGRTLDPELWNVLTLAAGEPVPGVDTGEKTLPPELGPTFEAATISYRKGCYTGQEVLMRMHSRGHANRTWQGLLSPVLLAPGANVMADGAGVGRITRAGVHPTLGPIAAAFLRREAEGRSLTVETSVGPAAVEARDLPLFSL